MQTGKPQVIVIDLKRTKTIPVPQFIQGDTNILDIVIKDDGVDVDFSNIGKIVANYKKPDGIIVSRFLTDKVGNKVTYKMGMEENEVHGFGDMELQFFKIDNTERVSTIRFKVFLAESIGTDKVYENDGRFPVLQEMIISIESIKNNIDEIIQQVTDSTTYATTQGDYAKLQADKAILELGTINATLSEFDAYIKTIPSGEKGDKGDRGDKGEKGDKGDRGEQGIQGIQGIQGEKGLDGTGSVVTVNNVSPDGNGNVALSIPTQTSQLTNNSGFITSSDISDKADKSYVNTELGKKIDSSQKGMSNGIATLGLDGKVPTAQLPPISNTASNVGITDTGNYFTSNNAEGVLQEIGQVLNGINGELNTRLNRILGS